MENKEEVRTFLFFEGIYDQVKRIEERLGAEKALNFLKDIMEFGIYDKKPSENSENWLYGLEPIFKTIEISKNRYKKSVEAGKKGGRPTANFNIYEAAQMRKAGNAYSKIGAHFGVSANTVKKYVDKPKSFEDTLKRLQKLSNFLYFPSEIKSLIEKEEFTEDEKSKLIDFFESID